MKNDELLIEVETRTALGKNANRRLRASGQVPAVLYGGGRETVSITIDRKKLRDLLRGGHAENTVFLLRRIGSDQQRHAMIREMQVAPMTREIVHLDFQRVLMDEVIRVQVPVKLVGVAYGVKNDGALLDFVTREVEVECLPGDIPGELELDVTPLHAGDHLEAKDLVLPAGVKLSEDPDRVIASCSYTKAEISAAEGDGLLEKKGDEPQVIKKGKKEE